MNIEELRERQSLSLHQKIDHSIGVIEQFISKTNGKCYIGFSGGKDSTVLLDLCRMVKPDMKAVFCNTGNEYPDIVKFVRNVDNIDIIYPTIRPEQIFQNFGFPLISKKMSDKIWHVKNKPNTVIAKRALGLIKRNNYNDEIPKKWEYLIKEKYNISSFCCDFLKKKPFYKYEKENRVYPIIGVMACESIRRTTDYLRQGQCNSFKGRMTSKPLSIWLEKDIWDYIELKHLQIADIYHKGAKRTGCMFCGYGCQFKEDNRLQVVYDLYPKWYDKFMGYTNNGITYKDALRTVLRKSGLFLPDEKPDLFK